MARRCPPVAPLPAYLRCFVCMQFAVEGCNKGITRLNCGHHFHIVCVGTEFNIRGRMECPACGYTERSEWRYSTGGQSNNPPPPLEPEASTSDIDLNQLPRDSPGMHHHQRQRRS